MRLKRFILSTTALTLTVFLLTLGQHLIGQRKAPIKPPLKHDLIQVCFSQDMEAARLLLAQGANPNIRSDQGLTPLIVAAAKGHPGLTQLLLAKGADVNARSGVPHEVTALQAVRYHRMMDVDRVDAVPGPADEGMRGQPVDQLAQEQDERYREVIWMLQRAIKKEKSAKPLRG